MKNLKLLFFISLFFFTKEGFSQNTVTYSSLAQTINLDSGSEGTVDIAVNCYGNSSSPVILNAELSCDNNSGILSTSYTNGNILTPGQSTIIRYKFKKTVTVDTQIIYKFSTNGSCFQAESDMIKITVNYKAGSTTNPPVIPPDLIYVGSWPINEVTINEGDTAPTITSSGPGNYTFKWYKTVNGITSLIPGATNYFYSPGKLLVTTQFWRENKSGTSTGSSGPVTINVLNNAPAILNNTISLDGSIVNGTLPTGGINSYQYSWVIHPDEASDYVELPDSGQNLGLLSPNFYKQWDSYPNLTITRLVTSGTQRSVSNILPIPHVPEIQNNIISINGKQVTGSTPTGGKGNYTYSWILDYSGDPIEFPETTKDIDLTPYLYTIGIVYQIDSSAKLMRVVTSGKSSTSNKLNIGSVTANTLRQTNTLEATVYPNPTSESVNFTTNYSSNKEIEIFVYSETIKNTQSIYKGIVKPNQTVTWNIPANYPKGIYYYKLISDNEEIKSGKIIYQ